jgi:hypothetical protein
MCDLTDVHYVEFRDECIYIYEVDDDGIPTALIRQDFWDHINDSGVDKAFALAWSAVRGSEPFACICGYAANDWDDVLHHCMLGKCDKCNNIRANVELDVWGGMCHVCGKAEEEAAAN